jgi:hypothetical protein
VAKHRQAGGQCLDQHNSGRFLQGGVGEQVGGW